MSTDTAFALGVLALVAPRRDAPAGAPADDRRGRRPRGAARDRHRLHGARRRRCRSRSRPALFGAAARAPMRADRLARRRPRRVLGVGVWVALHESGIDPLLAGLAVGLVIERLPAGAQRPRARDGADPLVPRAADPGAGALRPARRELGDLRRTSGCSTGCIPGRASRSCRCSRSRTRASTSTRTCSGTRSRRPMSLGILFGYVIGKPLGVIDGRVARDARPGPSGSDRR